MYQNFYIIEKKERGGEKENYTWYNDYVLNVIYALTSYSTLLTNVKISEQLKAKRKKNRRHIPILKKCTQNDLQKKFWNKLLVSNDPFNSYAWTYSKNIQTPLFKFVKNRNIMEMKSM